MKYIITFLVFIQVLYSQSFVLTNEQLDQLNKDGYILQRDSKNNNGMIIFDVDKDIDKVMDSILDLNSYPENIDDVGKVEIYSNSLNEVKAKIFIDTFFIDFHNYVIHDIDREKYSVKWHLDNKYKNYFAKMQGYWKLKKIGNKTRVFYFNDLEFKSWVPSFLKSYLFKKGLFKSTQWLKSE